MAENKKPPTRDVTMTLPITATNRNLTHAGRMARKPRKRRDLADIAGSWKTDKAIRAAVL